MRFKSRLSNRCWVRGGDRQFLAAGAICFLLLSVCFPLTVLIPPLQSPDEPAHIKRAYLLSRGQFVLDTQDGKASGGMVDTGLDAYLDAYKQLQFDPNRKVTNVEVESAKEILWSGEQEFVTAPGTAYSFPVLYFPHAIGLALGEVAGLSVDVSYRLARFLALGFSTVVLFAAFCIYSPPIIVVALLLVPMSLFQLTSASLDGMTTAFSILGTSCYMRLAKACESASGSLRCLLIVCMLVVIASKPYLIAMLVLVLAAVGAKDRRNWVMAAALVASLLMTWFYVAMGRTEGVTPGTPLSARLQYYFVDNPMSGVEVLTATLSDSTRSRYYFESFIGILGWLDTRFPTDTYALIAFILAPIILSSISLRELRSELLARGALVLCAIGTSVLVFVAALLIWNPFPTTLVQGVQGRYFFVPAVLLAYAVGSGSMSFTKSWRRSVSLALVLALGMFSASSTFNLLLSRYYAAEEQSRNLQIRIRASMKLARAEPIEVSMSEDWRCFPKPLKRIGIYFGTHARENTGTARLTLVTRSGRELAIRFRLEDLEDNRYRMFDLDDGLYVAGTVVSETGEGISVWEAHDENGRRTSCLVYEFANGNMRRTPGCPWP